MVELVNVVVPLVVDAAAAGRAELSAMVELMTVNVPLLKMPPRRIIGDGGVGDCRA